MKAELIFPILGYTEIRLIEKRNLKWLAELTEAELNIEIYEDEFVIEN